MEPTYLNPVQLAQRWNLSVNTLSQWRWNGKGPCYTKMGRHVSYLLQDIEEFENAKRRRSTSDPFGPQGDQQGLRQGVGDSLAKRRK